MAKLTINLPDSDSPEGVSLETLEDHVRRRGSRSVEEYINVLIAGALGFRPPAEGSRERFPELSRLRDSFDEQ